MICLKRERKVNVDEAIIKRIQPHNSEAEQSVIGSMIMDEDAVVVVSEMLSSDDFYDHQYGVLYEAIQELANEGRPVDLITLQQRLRSKSAPPELYGVEFLGGLVKSVPTSANVRFYATIVSEKALLRRLIKLTEKITNQCYLDKDKIETIIEDTERDIFTLFQKRGRSDFLSIKELVVNSLSNIEAASKIKGSVTGLATGFYDLDYKTAGLQPSDLILIAGRPSMGKTTFALNIAEHTAVRLGVSTAIFSLEMSNVQIVNRFLSMNSKIDSQSIRTGQLRDDDWVRLIGSARDIGESKLIIDDSAGINIAELRSKCRKYKLEHNLGLVIIDYIQLMSGNKKTESRQLEISDISRSLKLLARELDCPVVACAQLSRAVEQRQDKRPMLSDLRESGAIEQDADVVMFLYRDEYYNHDTEEKGVAEIIIGKQRNGPTGTVKLRYLSEYGQFRNMAHNAP